MSSLRLPVLGLRASSRMPLETAWKPDGVRASTRAGTRACRAAPNAGTAAAGRNAGGRADGEKAGADGTNAGACGDGAKAGARADGPEGANSGPRGWRNRSGPKARGVRAPPLRAWAGGNASSAIALPALRPAISNWKSPTSRSTGRRPRKPLEHSTAARKPRPRAPLRITAFRTRPTPHNRPDQHSQVESYVSGRWNGGAPVILWISRWPGSGVTGLRSFRAMGLPRLHGVARTQTGGRGAPAQYFHCRALATRKSRKTWTFFAVFNSSGSTK